MQFDAEGKALEADRNARALRTIEVGAYAGLYQLTGVINFSKSRTSDLATAGIDLHAAKSTALDILELNKALQKAGFNYLNDYIRVTSAPNGDMWRNDAVDRARSKISGLVADDLANLDRAMIFVFQNAGDNELMVAQSLQ